MTSCPTNKSCSSACRTWALLLGMMQPKQCNVLLLDIHSILTCLLAFVCRRETTMRAPARGWRSWWREWKTPRRSVKCRAPSRWRVTSTVRRSVRVLEIWTGFYNTSSDRLFPWQQGLWECHGSNITADIIRRGGSCSWCHVSRRTQLSRWRNLQLLQHI